MNFRILLTLILSLIFMSCESASPNYENKGHLMIIGGGERTAEIMQKTVDVAGGPKSRFVIIPQASSEPLETALYQQADILKYGAGEVSYMMLDSTNVDSAHHIQQIRNATAIFFSGGDQIRLTRLLLGTALLEEIKAFYKSGGLISGTSAGAAIQSELMITGEEHINTDEDRPYNTIAPNNIETVQGFGFVTEAIIDQHHIKRRRNNRVLSAVLEHPELLGVAIDESTAILVNPDRTFEVFGDATVIVYSAREARNIRLDKFNNFAMDDMKVHLLMNGDRFSLISGKRLP
ncbi:MAG: cyanophycinase [Candidatus Marinimicrobia bacterium]|nr:cyanophycinase [Candidatus Neomarinimicrobiota bacterium]